jgi:hypothetical protein
MAIALCDLESIKPDEKVQKIARQIRMRAIGIGSIATLGMACLVRGYAEAQCLEVALIDSTVLEADSLQQVPQRFSRVF